MIGVAALLFAGSLFSDATLAVQETSIRSQEQTEAHGGAEPPVQRVEPEAGERKPSQPASGGGALVSPILTLKLALLADPRSFPYFIDIEGGDRQVLLSGKVSAEAEKEAAAAIVSNIMPLSPVVNRLEVAPGLGRAILKKQDETITGYVKERFDHKETLKNAGFIVRTENGIVILSGSIRSPNMVFEAAEATRSIPGVRAVRTNEVRIESAN